MPSDDQRLMEHPINAVGDQLRAALDAFDDDTRESLEAQSPGWIARIGAAADWADGLSGLLDPRLVAFPVLDSVHEQLMQALNHVPGAPGDVSYANQAELSAGQAVREAGGLAMAAPPLPELADAIGKRVGRAVSLRATALTRELDDVEARLHAVRQEVDQAREQTTAADQQRVAEQTQRIDALTQSVDAERARVDSFVTTAINENQQAERDRQKTHQEALKQQETEFEAVRDTLSTKAEESLTKFREDAKAQLDAAGAEHTELTANLKAAGDDVFVHLDDVKGKVDEVYEVIVKKGLSGAFAAEAKTQATAANIWRWVAIAFGVVAIVVALYTALHEPEKLTWEALVAKLAVSALLGALATYAGKQSGLHRRREIGAKELELDLTAIGPFLEQLPPDQRVQAIQAFTQRWMTARAIAGPDGGGSPLLVSQIIEGLGRFVGSGEQRR